MLTLANVNQTTVWGYILHNKNHNVNMPELKKMFFSEVHSRKKKTQYDNFHQRFEGFC